MVAAMVNQPDPVDRLVSQLGLKDVRIVRQRLAEVVRFFRTEVRADPLEWVDYLFGIDFYREVGIVTLRKGTTLVRYEEAGRVGRDKPFVYFTKAGTDEMRLGTNQVAPVFTRYSLANDVRALESRAASISFRPRVGKQGQVRFDRRPRPGGGVQYIVARLAAPVQPRLL
jgi:hypothetical protein